MTTRFLSPHDQQIIQIVPLVQEAYATGLTKVIQPEVLCVFHSDGIRPHEREFALSQFAFRGLYQEMDEVTTVQPDYRLGVFDTIEAQMERHWSNETRSLVESKLIEIATNHGHVLVAPRSSVPPPWPRYDEYTGTKVNLIKKLVGEGHDLQRVLTYERESQNRPDVIEAIEGALAGVEPQLEEIVG